MPNSKENTQQESQKAAAESLRRQIDELTSGKKPQGRPSSLRDFIDRKMAEDNLNKDEANSE
jgi:hypothetical protein